MPRIKSKSKEQCKTCSRRTDCKCYECLILSKIEEDCYGMDREKCLKELCSLYEKDETCKENFL